MINRLLESLKDPARRGYWFAALYFISIVVTAAILFSLRNDLVYKGGMVDNTLATNVFITLYVVIGITLTLGVTAINLIIKHKKEVIVYLERKEERTTQQTASTTSGESIDIDSFRKAIAQAKDNAAQTGLNQLCKVLQAGQGALYESNNTDGKRSLQLKANFALALGETETISFEYGEGLVGQSAASGISLYLDEIPEGYINIVSGLGNAQPRYLFVMPLKKDKEVVGVIEVATFGALSENVRQQAEAMASILAESLTQK